MNEPDSLFLLLDSAPLSVPSARIGLPDGTEEDSTNCGNHGAPKGHHKERAGPVGASACVRGITKKQACAAHPPRLLFPLPLLCRRHRAASSQQRQVGRTEGWAATMRHCAGCPPIDFFIS
jgi:hypothetical protein